MICNKCKNYPCLISKMAPLDAIRNGKRCEFFSDKSPFPCRHTLEDGADATTELVSGKSSGLIGGMRQEKTNLSDERIDTKQAKAISG